MSTEIIYFKGEVAVYYIQNASPMATSVTTTTNVTSTGSPSSSARMYEFPGVLLSGALGTYDDADNGSGSDTVVQAGNVTAQTGSLLFVASIGGTTAGTGFTSGVVNADQYILNAANEVYGTSFGNSAEYWAAIGVTFLPITNVTVTPSGVGATFAEGTVSPKAGATILLAGLGVNAVFALGEVFVPRPGVGEPFPVKATFSVAALTAGIPINYGTVVSGSSTLPSGVNSTYFYARFTGFLSVATNGNYTFGLNVQDGADLYIGTQPILKTLSATQTANTVIAYNTATGTVELQANVLYPIILEWQHGSGASYECQLLWTPPGSTAAVVIPTANLQYTGYWWNGNSSSWYPNTWY